MILEIKLRSRIKGDAALDNVARFLKRTDGVTTKQPTRVELARRAIPRRRLGPGGVDLRSLIPATQRQ